MPIKLAQSRNEHSRVAAVVGMVPPHELTAPHVLLVTHPRPLKRVTRTQRLKPAARPASRTRGISSISSANSVGIVRDASDLDRAV